MSSDFFFLASSSAFIDDEALVHAPRLVLFACWRIFLFLLCFVVLFAAAKLSFAPAKPLFAPTKLLFAPTKPSFAGTKRYETLNMEVQKPTNRADDLRATFRRL